MNAKAKKDELTVVELSPVDRAELSLKSRETETTLRELVAGVASIQSVTSHDGRTECHAAYMSLRNARVAVESCGKKAREDATAFSKAVIAEEKKLVAIVDAEETRLKALRDEWDAAREAERQALIEAERQRVAAIRERIASLAAIPARNHGKRSDELADVRRVVLSEFSRFSDFEELAGEAEAVCGSVLDQLDEMIDAAFAREAAEAARLAAEAEAKAAAEAEAARVAAESERLARERESFEAEQARVAEAARIEAEKLAEERRKIDADRAAFEAMLKATEAEKTPSVDAWFEPKATEAPVYSAHLAERLDEVDAMVDAMFDPVATVDEADAVVDSVFDPILERSSVIVDGVTLDDLTNAVCQLIPVGFILSLNMENGAAWVSLDMVAGRVELPDSSDKSIAEQLDDALAQSGVFNTAPGGPGHY